MSLTGVAAVAGAGVVVLLGFFALLAFVVNPKKGFFGSVILGADGRTSTSKTFVLLWTLLVAWALFALLIAGQFLTIRGCVLHHHHARAACRGNQLALLQLGWHNFLKAPLSGAYLILLGIPGAAAVTAKGITQSNVNGNGFKTKRPASKSTGQRLARVTEIFSADDGTTDIGDFQYLIFNLITAVYFVTQFLHPDGTGLPTIPDTLLGLTGVSASVYVGKKAVTRSQPVVTGVFPLPLHDGEEFTVLGTDLTAQEGASTDAEPQVTIDGMSASVLATRDGHLIVRAPHTISVAGAPLVRKLRVLNPYGGITADFDVSCL